MIGGLLAFAESASASSYSDSSNFLACDRLCQPMSKGNADKKTRPDTRLPQSRAGGQGLYLRTVDHLGRSSLAEDRKNPKKEVLHIAKVLNVFSSP